MRAGLRHTPVMLAMLAALLVPSGTRAQAVTDSQALGAALVVPYLTSSPGGDRVTVATVTNALSTQGVTLHLIWISGDPEDEWAALDYDCPLTPLETTFFVFENNADGTANVTFECSNLGLLFPTPTGTNNQVTRQIPGEDGILFVAVECQLGSAGCPGGTFGLRTRAANALVGDATVVDFGQGSAFSVGAIHFQGLANDGDRLYEFDGLEYRAFPSLLTTSYIAPDDDTSLELILFTLDGKVNAGPGIGAHVVGVAFDDDENPTSGAITFDGFVVQDVSAPPNRGFGNNVRRDVGGHLVGHLELFPTTTLAGDVHDFDPLTGGVTTLGARRRPVHGWIVQTTRKLGDVAGTGNRSSSPASWGRTLGQGTFPFTPLGGDVPSLNAGPPPF